MHGQKNIKLNKELCHPWKKLRRINQEAKFEVEKVAERVVCHQEAHSGTHLTAIDMVMRFRLDT